MEFIYQNGQDFRSTKFWREKGQGSILQIIMLSYLLDFKWNYQPSSGIYNSGVQQSNESWE